MGVSSEFRRIRPSDGIVLAAGLISSAAMVWICLTDPLISQSLWPADIHGRVVSVFGGTSARLFGGMPTISLSLLSVFIRCFGGAVLLASAATLWDWLRVMWGSDTAPSGRRTWSFRSSAERLFRMGRVGVWSGLWLILYFAASALPQGWPVMLISQTASLALALLGAGVLCALWNNTASSVGVTECQNAGAVSSSWRITVVAVMMCWIAVSFWMNERLYAGLWIPHGDSAMYEEHLWNVWHGKGFRSYLDQGLFLGEHIQVIHLLLLPLHMLWPSHLLLELAESVSLGICAIPIFRMARRASGSSEAAMWLSLAWLFFYPMHFLDIAIDIKTLRPGCYGLPFLFWGIDLAESRRLKAASVCLLIAMSAQEDFALVIGPLGLAIWYEHRCRTSCDSPESQKSRAVSGWGAIVCGCSVIYLLAAVLVIIPAFRGGASVHYSRYFGDLGNSPGELIRTLLKDPMRVASDLFTPRTLVYFLIFTVPLGFLPVKAPKRLVAGIFTFVMISLIQLGNSPSASDTAVKSDESDTQLSNAAESGTVPESGKLNSGKVDSEIVGEIPPVPYHHFHTPLLPVLFWAAVGGLAIRKPGFGTMALQRSRNLTAETLRSGSRTILWGTSAAKGRFAFFCAVLTGVSGSMMPVGAGFWSRESFSGYSRLYVPGQRAVEFEKVLAMLPPDARVASTDYVHTRLTHFQRSYDYSDYLRAVNNYQPGVPDDTDYIVIDTRHPYSRIASPSDVTELRTESARWELLPDTTSGYFIVLRRRPAAESVSGSEAVVPEREP